MAIAHSRKIVVGRVEWRWALKYIKASHRCDDPRCCGLNLVRLTIQRADGGDKFCYTLPADPPVTPKKVSEIISRITLPSSQR